MMTKQEILEIVNNIHASIPERLTGNEEIAIITERLQSIVLEERQTMIEVLRDWISVRIPENQRKKDDGKKEGTLYLALEVAKKYSLKELRPDIEALIADIHSGKTYLPYYEEMIAKYLNYL